MPIMIPNLPKPQMTQWSIPRKIMESMAIPSIGGVRLFNHEWHDATTPLKSIVTCRRCDSIKEEEEKGRRREGGGKEKVAGLPVDCVPP